MIRDLNPVLRGWGNYFRTGNAALKFNQLDGYVQRRLRRLLARRYGRNLRPGHYERWTSDWFRDMGVLEDADTAAILTAHPGLDVERVLATPPLVVDFREVTRGIEAPNLVRL